MYVWGRGWKASLAGYTLDKVRTFKIGDTSMFLASVYGVSAPNRKNIEELEALLRQESGTTDFRLVLNFVETNLYDRSGLIRLKFSGLGLRQDSHKQEINDCVAFLKNEIAAVPEVTVSGVNYDVVDGVLYVMIDTRGPKILSPEEVYKLQDLAAEKAGIPVKLFIHAKTEIAVTSGGHESFTSVSVEGFKRQLPSIREDISKIIEKSYI